MNLSTSISVLAIAVLLPACASNGAGHQAGTMEEGAVNPEKTAAARVSVSTLTATVKSVDMSTRMVTLVDKEGDEIAFEAGEEVRNLGQVKVGDKVTVEYYEGLLADLQTGAAAQQGGAIEEAMVMERAPLGGRPAGAVGRAVRARVTIDFVDPLRNVVHFTGPLGRTHIVKVAKPEFRAMLKNLKAGDQVDLTYFEAFLISVRPAD